MSKRNEIGWFLLGVMTLVLGFNTADLIHMFNGWHLAFRIALNVVVLGLFVVSLSLSKKSN